MKRWLWGTLATWTLRMHIKKEIRPATEAMGATRENALEVMKDRLRLHFDVAWPEAKQNTPSETP